ncbi:hypothetical protein ACE414_05370 [Alteromonas macleodii]|jgi:ethanolamine transporter EutH|uniref:hypothetical protein n=1 Tax=Alteromonas TaxID=226 RepID=UPI000D76B8B5|nr:MULTISPECIES: hypothetical protein [Alteromonas]MCZ4240099.1 hypothetical protein [Alteromonas macleodii]PXW71109.1 hypothetical protein BZA03_10935 [Alteromonas sp. I10]
MVNKKEIILALVLTGYSICVLADSEALNNAATKLCDKSKMCIGQEMSANDEFSPKMKAMLSNMVEEICGQYMSIADLGDEHELIEPATECLNSMANQGCDALLNSDEETTACKRYSELAENY